MYTCSLESLWFDSSSNPVDTIVDQCIKSNQSVIILTALWEAVDISAWQPALTQVITQIHTHRPTVTIILIINSWYRTQPILVAGITEVVYIDFFLLMVAYRLEEGDSCAAKTWNANLDKFLFLTGKPDRLNRIRLLYKLKKHNLLSCCIWSFFINDALKNRCLALLPELSTGEGSRFIEEQLRNPDLAPIIMQDKSLHYSGIPFDTTLYENTLFQIISETDYITNNRSPWITEKTWLAIINRRPFIMAAAPGTLQKLKIMGFKTFEQYQLNKDYDYILDNEARLTAIVDNSQYWLSVIQQQSVDIQKDIDYNFSRMTELITSNYQQLQNVIERYSLNCKINQIISFRDELQYATWINWYNRVRDPSWPDCAKEEDFSTLPLHIQKECIEIFNYIPREKK